MGSSRYSPHSGTAAREAHQNTPVTRSQEPAPELLGPTAFGKRSLLISPFSRRLRGAEQRPAGLFAIRHRCWNVASCWERVRKRASDMARQSPASAGLSRFVVSVVDVPNPKAPRVAALKRANL